MSETDASVLPSQKSPETLIEAQGLCKFYGSREILHNVSLSIQPREIVTLVGPNGAGKTTLLKILLGLEKPQRGQVKTLPGLRIGYVPQHFVPQPSMPLTARAFLELYGPKSPKRIAELSALLDIAEVLDSPLVGLSGGEQRRLLLLRALLHKPHLLVLDEPTQGVDVAGQGELYRLLKKLSEEQGFAVLMVSHDLYVVMASTERVICLNHHICCEGAPSSVGNDPSFRQLFGDDLARQLAMYHHHHDHAHDVHGDHFHHDHAGHHHD
jgi:zinc transport system ATP-binding protein